MSQPKPDFTSNNTKRRTKLSKILITLSIIVVILAGLSIVSYRSANRALASAKAGQASFLSAQQSIENQEFKQTQVHLDQALDSFSEAKRSLTALAWLKVVPLAANQYNAAQHVLNAGIATGEALRDVAGFASTTIEPLAGNGQISLASLTPSDKRVILENFVRSETVLISANDKIELAVAEIDKIPERGLAAPLRQAIDPINEKLPLIKSLVNQFVTFARIIPKIAGYPQPQTYLFLLENNTELRPTGGFIGTYGILKVKDGEIVSFATDNIYNLDVPAESFLDIEPPEPLNKYLKSASWFLRDSNWSPHFPEAAEKALWFYQQERGPEKNIDGVIAVTPSFIESLIELTGDLSVQGITFTKENFVDTLQYQVEQGYYRQGLSDSERKEIIGQLSSVLLERLLALPQSKWDDFWTTFTNDIERKQILIYSRDPDAQATVREENWGGEVVDTPGDYLMLVDANMAALKSDPGVKRLIDYRLESENDQARAKLKITYRNEGTITWKSTRYRSYTRIYVPAGSQLIANSGFVTNDRLQNGQPSEAVILSELNKTVFAGFIAIEPQAEGSIELEYILPDSIYKQIRNSDYALTWQKQPGAAAHQFTFTLATPFRPKVTLPADLIDDLSSDSIRFQGALEGDLKFIVTN